jgi:hypothetical protein
VTTPFRSYICRRDAGGMRTTILAFVALAGCYDFEPGTHGETAKYYAGTVSVVFTNATPDAMCNLSMAADSNDVYGDNWLPAGGLASGKSMEFHIKPGRYKATWNTCHHKGQSPYYAGTLFRERAFEIKDSTQLFAFIPDTVAPTKHASIVAHRSVVRFEGMTIGETTGRVQEEPETVASATPAPAPSTLDIKSFVDVKAHPKKAVKLRPSVARAHDMADDARETYRSK